MKVVIFHDVLPADPSTDQLDVLIQAEAVSAALIELGHRPVIASMSLDLGATETDLARLAPDLVFNLVESLGGRGRLIYVAPALLDALSIPYTGAPTEAMFQTSNKTLAKSRLREHGIATPPWYSLSASRAHDFKPGRYIIKSLWEDASIGLDEDSVVLAEEAGTLREEIESRLDRLGGDGFAETYIDGREFNLSLLAGDDGPVVLGPSEIEFVGYGSAKPKVVGYRAKWDEDSFEFQHTPHRFEFPKSDRPLLEKLTAVAVKCWELFELRGYARVDFRVDAEGRPCVLEINANPCLSPDAGFVAAVQRSGLSFVHAVERIIQDVEPNATRANQAASLLPHGRP
jgi:D-alanine-D-alanine ligase